MGALEATGVTAAAEAPPVAMGATPVIASPPVCFAVIAPLYRVGPGTT